MGCTGARGKEQATKAVDGSEGCGGGVNGGGERGGGGREGARGRRTGGEGSGNRGFDTGDNERCT